MPYFYGINTGENEYQVTQNATTTGKDIEVAINTNANVPSTTDLIVALWKLANAILRSGKPW